MKIKLFSLYFFLYILIVGSSMFILENDLYSLKTSRNLTGRRVCLILVDGLRYDSVHSMEFLYNISNSSSGVMYKSLASSPSNSRPGYERIITGTDTIINGIKNNSVSLPSLTPNLFYAAAVNGLKTSSSSFYWIKMLYPLRIDKGYYYYIKDGITFSKATEYINTYYPDFILVHPMTVDTAGHKFGGASKEYEASVVKTDKEIEHLWQIIKHKGYTMVVTSDHGHSDKGGHGDMNPKSIETPLFIIDENLFSLKPLPSNINVRQIDIAPTISDILGLPKSIYMYGDSLVAHNSEISIIRSAFASKYINDFNQFFKTTSLFTYFILSIYTVVLITNSFIILEIIKGKV